MALLGAKRPQDRAWQFIVLSLWAILSLPSFEWMLFGGRQEIHAARFAFLLILLGIGLANGLPTRYWPTSLLIGLGQLVLVMPFMMSTQDWMPVERGPLLAIVAFVAGWSLEAVGWPRATRGRSPWDRLWLDFRDNFGTVRGLRVAERINATSALVGWPVRVGWSGFQVTSGNPHDLAEMPAAVEEGTRALLRRFVPPEWIDTRMDNEFRVAEASLSRVDAATTSTR
jgi:hypothetical protein